MEVVPVKNLLFLYNFVVNNLDEESKQKMDGILVNVFGEASGSITPILMDIFNKMSQRKTLDDDENFLLQAKLNITPDKYSDYQELLTKVKSVPNITEDPFDGGKRRKRHTKRVKRLKNKKNTKRYLKR